MTTAEKNLFKLNMKFVTQLFTKITNFSSGFLQTLV